MQTRWITKEEIRRAESRVNSLYAYAICRYAQYTIRMTTGTLHIQHTVSLDMIIEEMYMKCLTQVLVSYLYEYLYLHLAFALYSLYHCTPNTTVWYRIPYTLLPTEYSHTSYTVVQYWDTCILLYDICILYFFYTLHTVLIRPPVVHSTPWEQVTLLWTTGVYGIRIDECLYTPVYIVLVPGTRTMSCYYY